MVATVGSVDSFGVGNHNVRTVHLGVMFAFNTKVEQVIEFLAGESKVQKLHGFDRIFTLVSDTPVDKVDSRRVNNIPFRIEDLGNQFSCGGCFFLSEEAGFNGREVAECTAGFHQALCCFGSGSSVQHNPAVVVPFVDDLSLIHIVISFKQVDYIQCQVVGIIHHQNTQRVVQAIVGVELSDHVLTNNNVQFGMSFMDFSEGIIQVFIGIPAFVIDTQFINDIFSHNDTSSAHRFFLRRDAVENAIDLAAVSLFFADSLNDALTIFSHQVNAVPVLKVNNQVLGNVSGSLVSKGEEDIQLIAAGQHQTKLIAEITEAKSNSFKGHTQFFRGQVTDSLHNFSLIGLFRTKICHGDLISAIGRSAAFRGSRRIGAGRFSGGSGISRAVTGSGAAAGSKGNCTQGSGEDSCQNSFFHKKSPHGKINFDLRLVWWFFNLAHIIASKNSKVFKKLDAFFIKLDISCFQIPFISI